MQVICPECGASLNRDDMGVSSHVRNKHKDLSKKAQQRLRHKMIPIVSDSSLSGGGVSVKERQLSKNVGL
jgi:hypothetical protein